MAKKEEDYIKNIKLLIDAIKRNPEDPKVFQLADIILSICKKIENKELAKSIKTQIIILMNTIDVAVRLQAIGNIEQLLSSEEEEKETRFIQFKNIQRTKGYKADCKKYKSQANIDEVEFKIISYSYTKKLHEMITKGKWEGYCHAHLTKNLRIMYHWYPNEGVLVFEAIITKNMLEKG